MNELLIIKRQDLDLLLAECSNLMMIKSSDSLLFNKIREYVPKVVQLDCKKKDEGLIANVLFFYVKATAYCDIKYPFISKEFNGFFYDINCCSLGNEVHYLVNFSKII